MIVYGDEDDDEKDGGRGTNPSTPTRTTRRKENVVANFMMDQYISRLSTMCCLERVVSQALGK